MKKLKLQLTGFDIGMIIAFVVVTLLGAAAWYYLSAQLLAAQQANKAAMDAFQKYSVGTGIVVSPANRQNLEANGGVLKDQVDPIIKTYLLSKDSKNEGAQREDPVAWKHDLDAEVHALTSSAKVHNVALPPNFYFGFSRYLTQSPSDESTGVLTRQRIGIKDIANILINASVHGITLVQRTYEEDPHLETFGGSSEKSEGDHLSGYALPGPGKAYTDYPFSVEFDADVEQVRPVIDQLIASADLFIVRSAEVHNVTPDSPHQDDLARMAGTTGGEPSPIDAGPGAVAAGAPGKGPQYLFGYSLLHVKLRVDMIEWNTQLANSDAAVTALVASANAAPGHAAPVRNGPIHH